MDPAEDGAAVPVPGPALVVLVGPSGSGKSAWAAERYRPHEVVSSDRLRAMAGSDEHDLDASADAFALLDQITAARLRRGLTAVVDTLGLDQARRRGYLALARSSGMPAVAVLFDTDPAECRRRNRARGRGVPATVLEVQLRRMRAAVAEIRDEGWDLVTTAGSAQPEASHTPGASAAASEQRQRPVRMGQLIQGAEVIAGQGVPGAVNTIAILVIVCFLIGIARSWQLIGGPSFGIAQEITTLVGGRERGAHDSVEEDSRP